MHAFATSERFAHLDRRDRDRLEAISKLDEFDPGEEILAAGHPNDSICLVVSGLIEVRAKTRRGEVVLCQLRPGDLFGEVEAFATLPEGVRYVAREDTIVRAVPKNPLRHEVLAHRNLAVGLLHAYSRSISEKLRAANEVAVPPQSAVAGRAAAPTESAERSPHLSEDEAAWLALLGHEVSAAPGQPVVEEGDATRSFFLVREGELEVRKKLSGGKDRTLARLGPRDLFGFMAFVDGKPRSASVIAATSAQLAKVDPDALEKATHLNFTVGFKFLGTLCGVLGRTYGETVRQVIAAS
jgi:CRP-like cAMP-binding protein